MRCRWCLRKLHYALGRARESYLRDVFVFVVSGVPGAHLPGGPDVFLSGASPTHS